jgi:hypothetical protein
MNNTLSNSNMYSSTIIENISRDCHVDPSLAIAFFYFDFTEPQKRHHASFVLALIIQLSTQCATTFRALATLHAECNHGLSQPTTAALMKILQDTIGSLRHAYVVLDALDECMEREKLCGLIEQIVDWELDGLHLLVTSRREKDIEDHLSPRVSGQIDIQSTLVDADIRVHLREQLQTDIKFKIWPPEVQQEIETTLMNGAHGM